MSKQLILLSTVLAATLAVSACSSEQRAADLPPGKYQKTTRSTDAYGTTTERRDVTNVTVDEYGDKDATVESETTKDPKGLFNKKTVRKTKTNVHTASPDNQ